MDNRVKTFSPGKSEIFWCQTCNLPLLSEKCSVCNSLAKKIILSPPHDVRLCSFAGRDLLKKLFYRNYGYANFLDDRVILLNKIAGVDRRDQVILDGHHIATIWFDITTGNHKLDLEMAGAALLCQKAKKNVVKCHDWLLKGHVKGKWLRPNDIESQPETVTEGDNVLLKIGKFVGVGVVRMKEKGLSIRVKDITQKQFPISDRVPTLDEVVRANEGKLKGLEKAALAEIKDYLRRNRLPVNVSFSGGKDSQASLILCQKVLPKVDVLYINTGLEFPETIQYVRDYCSREGLNLKEIQGKNSFFEQVKSFGPPAKDFRWCCKTNKLGPMTSFLQAHYPRGCVTIEGRRIYESFNRSTIKPVERNPYVPGQTTLSPIRNWTALEVMLYIRWNKQEPNSLYEQDFERIGCWLCPASMQSEFARLKELHPELHLHWTECLNEWAKENLLDHRYIDWGFWRWRRQAPKMIELANAHDIDFRIRSNGSKDISCQIIKGRSPCGLDFSIEAALSLPQNHPFPVVAGALNMIGIVKYSEDLGAAVIKTDTGRITVFANGVINIIADQKNADELLRRVFETILRVQLCTKCKICEKNCSQGAISIEDTIFVDEKKCNRCGKCSKGCIAANEAAKVFRKIAAAG